MNREDCEINKEVPVPGGGVVARRMATVSFRALYVVRWYEVSRVLSVSSTLTTTKNYRNVSVDIPLFTIHLRIMWPDNVVRRSRIVRDASNAVQSGTRVSCAPSLAEGDSLVCCVSCNVAFEQFGAPFFLRASTFTFIRGTSNRLPKINR